VCEYPAISVGIASSSKNEVLGRGASSDLRSDIASPRFFAGAQYAGSGVVLIVINTMYWKASQNGESFLFPGCNKIAKKL